MNGVYALLYLANVLLLVWALGVLAWTFRGEIREAFTRHQAEQPAPPPAQTAARGNVKRKPVAPPRRFVNEAKPPQGRRVNGS